LILSDQRDGSLTLLSFWSSLETTKERAVSMIAHPHIRLDEQGVARIDDANVKVIEVVLDRLAYGWSPEEIHFQHPSLSLAQIHAALAYYYDHQAVIDAEIARQEHTVSRLRTEAGHSPLVARLKARGLVS
jgi:uncharacterized protein (DUF433 family)